MTVEDLTALIDLDGHQHAPLGDISFERHELLGGERRQ
jgi:hypothetical protein